MSLFQRIRSPFADSEEDSPAPPQRRGHPVGNLLRERREELGLNLNEIGEALCIKPVYLAALEQGRAQELPGPTYAIGFIRAYAHYLGFDAERVLERYKAESAEVHARPDLSLPVPLGARSLPGGPILLVGLILALCGYGTWYYLSTGERSRPERVAAVPAALRPPPTGIASPSPADAAAEPGTGAAAGAQFASGIGSPPEAAASSGTAVPTTAEPSPPSTALVASPAAAAAPPPPDVSSTAAAHATGAAASGNTAATTTGRIDVRALADCWIQVRAGDQTIVFSRVLKAGETYHVPRPGLFLRTGNAGALAFAVDGKPAPSIGGIGMLRRNVALDPEALLAGTAIRG